MSAEPHEDTRALPSQPAIRRWLNTRAAWILLLDVALVIFFTAANGNFLVSENIQSLLLSGTEALLLALGLSMLLGAGKFDLSLGANLVLSSVVGAKLMLSVAGTANVTGTYSNLGAAIVVGLLACVGTGMVFGLVNGLLISYLDINSLIATLGTLGAGTGLTLVITGGGTDVIGVPGQLQSGFGLATVAGLPLPAIAALALAAALWAIVRYTRFGLRTVAIGSSRSAADRAGVNVRRHLLAIAVLAGGFAGLAGFMDLAQYLTTAINGHPNDALNAITAVVIGGTLLEGGRISIPGTIWGVALSVILLGGLNILGISSSYQLIAISTVLIFAVALDRFSAVRRSQA